MAEPIPFGAVLDSKKPAGLTIEIINDSAHADAVNRAVAQRDAAQRRWERSKSTDTTNELIEAEQALEEARSAARAHTSYWRFGAIGRESYEGLRDAHPSTKEQRAQNRKKMNAIGQPNAAVPIWNTETFPPALIAASCVGVFATEEQADEAVLDPDEPYMTLEQATELWNSKRFNSAELDALFSAALVINTNTRTADLGNG